MIRIRYKKEEGNEHILISKRVIQSHRTGAQYRVILNIKDKTYKIKNINSERIIHGGEKINNVNVLKRTVKKHLAKLGVVFGEEERFRTFGLCEKGMTQEKWMQLNNYEI